MAVTNIIHLNDKCLNVIVTANSFTFNEDI